MKPILASLAALLLLSQSAAAATQTFDVRTRLGSTAFTMEVLGDDDGAKAESYKNGRPFIAARNGETYSIRLYNPLPVRVAVNLTVDGLNSISGKPSGIEDGQKWLIEPYGTLVVRGWQVNGGEARRFFFTDKPKSYAKWRGEVTGKDLAANCGVIGAAFFWNREELARYDERKPAYLFGREFHGVPAPEAAAAASGAAQAAPYEDSGMNKAASARGSMAKAKRQEAGTGMGERESNPTTQVEFHYDAGMYRVSQAVLIYYDFAAPEPMPNPYPSLSYAPEM